jgi:hypothetical protein
MPVAAPIHSILYATVACLVGSSMMGSTALAFSLTSTSRQAIRSDILSTTQLSALLPKSAKQATVNDDDGNNDQTMLLEDRRTVLSALLASGGVLLYGPGMAHCAETGGDDESFASIAERANRMSKEIDAVRPRRSTDSMIRPTNQTMYDFTLPIEGVATPLAQIVRQEFMNKRATTVTNDQGEALTYKDAKVKAIIVVNIKQDDPVARKTMHWQPSMGEVPTMNWPLSLVQPIKVIMNLTRRNYSNSNSRRNMVMALIPVLS